MAYDLHPNERLRLESKNPLSDKGSDYWFRYNKLNLFGNIYEKLAKKVIKLIEKQAEFYWNKNKSIISKI